MNVVTIRDRDFNVVSRSRNLRGVLDHARQPGQHVERIDIWPNGGHAQLGLTFADGSSTICDFASAEVLRGWVASRMRRSRGWACAQVNELQPLVDAL